MCAVKVGFGHGHGAGSSKKPRANPFGTGICIDCQNVFIRSGMRQKCCVRCGITHQKKLAKAYHKAQRAANLEEIRAKDRARIAANPQKNRDRTKAWAAANPERVSERNRAKYEANKEPKIRQATAWNKENKERRNEITRASAKRQRILNPEKARAGNKKRRLDPAFRAFESVSELIRQSLKGQKNGYSWEALVGYSREALRLHLERQFLPGMTWKNYGKWHIDHILPRVSFLFDSAEHPDFKACWALSNLRPLWAVDNMKKSGRRTHLL